ncbi:MAG: Asp-tRNA(Asn)/Glu-tRNA(Gln) amidotransferase subunit GatA [Candidatus Omnitrophica bacterium]|nr:Asp-tRNA(Asn)/Glu-tRNA(Gln) amidotransferase subunit GatA [Candidatus Omnitrophota bacterium]
MGWISDFKSRNSDIQSTIDTCLKTIALKDPELAAFVKVECDDSGRAASGAIASKSGKLRGVPIALKDNICVKGWEITCASRILKGYVAPYHATVVERLLSEGAVLIGRTNMDEFAFGSSCETSAYGPTRNPHDPSRAPGGSSGGSAAAVAADMVPVALGSDTGGSIRQPAAFCGVVGLKPTYGRVSRFGLVAFASSLDQIGPLTRSVEDAALVLEVIAGADRRDSTSADVPVDVYSKALGGPVKGLKIGIPKEFIGRGAEPAVEEGFRRCVELLAREGAEIVEVSLPHTEYAVSVYYVVAPCEASSNLARFDGVRYGRRDPAPRTLAELYERSRHDGFGTEAKRRIILGTYALSSGYYDAYYLKAMRVRRQMIREFNEVFKRVDLLATPTAPTGAFRIGEKTGDPLQMYLSDIFTISANLAGIPAVSIPSGVNAEGLPVGFQLMGRAFDESTLLKAAYAVEDKLGAAG